MRAMSPSSSGLLPATYSRRRRGGGRPTETLAVESVANSGYTYVHDTAPQHSTNSNPLPTSTSPGNSTSSARRIRQLSRRTADVGKLSDDENDENIDYQSRRRQNDFDAYDQGYEDVLDKPLKLSDFLTNDRCYQQYMTEGKRSSYRGIGGNNKATKSKGILDPEVIAKIMAGCSFVGMVFLIWVAFMMETHPLFLKGVPVKSSSDNSDDGSYRFRTETNNAIKAAAAYFVTMVCSIIYIQVKDMQLELNNHPAMGRVCYVRRLIVSSYFRYRRRHYEDIPDGSFGVNISSSTPSVLPTHNSGNSDLVQRPNRGAGKRKDSSPQRMKSVEGTGSAGFINTLRCWFGGGSSKSGRKKDR
mmetsp:Transcript_22175/g.49344  ORF Transcript_22175/g.49344 Transcript_22175/m.49344 type:complete len:358 (-) Transcript_22175:42-1115(-)